MNMYDKVYMLLLAPVKYHLSHHCFPFFTFVVVVVVVVSLIQQSGTRTGLHGVFISPMRECSLRRLVIY